MSEIVIPSSPNWFLSDCIRIGADGYVVYGTLSVSIAILTPARAKFSFSDLKIINSAHKMRVSCLSLCPDWLTSRNFVSGADDGFVKLWYAAGAADVSKIAHNVHSLNGEEVAAVEFLNNKLVFSIGTLGYVTIWNIQTNSIQTNQKKLKGYRPICVALCPHKEKVLAVGTKQGVIIVLSIGGDYNDTINIVFKAPGHDTEITSLSWCPTLNCSYFDSSKPLSKFHFDKKSDKSKKHVEFSISQPDKESTAKSEVNVSDLKVPDDHCDKDICDSTLSKTEHENQETPKVESKSTDFLDECNELLMLIKSRKKGGDDELKSDIETTLSNVPEYEDEDDDSHSLEEPFKKIPDAVAEELNASRSTDKREPLEPHLIDPNREPEADSHPTHDDSDIFDIYEEDTMEEFGHTKYKSEPLYPDRNMSDRLILHTKKSKHKQPPVHQSITDSPQIQEIISQEKNIPEAFEKLSITPSLSEKSEDDTNKCNIESLSADISSLKIEERKEIESAESHSEQNCSYYLASCCKKGILCVWKWGGSMMMRDEIKSSSKKKPTHPFGVVLWVDTLKILIGGKESQLMCYDLLGKFKTHNLHNAHKRGLFNIVSGTSDNDFLPIVWTTSMDRLLAAYSFDDKSTCVYSTFGGYVHDVQLSPIDSKTFAVGSADGLIRVWRIVENDGSLQSVNFVRQLWNGINGKILSLAWHPTKENTLAFSTLEGRIGLVNVSNENPAQILPFALPLGAHHICWGLPSLLFACGGDALVVYDVKQTKIVPEKVNITVSDSDWKISTMTWTQEYLSVGSSSGGLALLNPVSPYNLVTSGQPHRKAITCIVWHPKAVITEDDVSEWANLVAVSSKSTNIVVMRSFEMSGQLMLETFRDFVTHAENVTCLRWDPHRNGRLLSTSHDYSVQIWDVLENCLLHTFTDHQNSVLCAEWCTSLPNHVISGSNDCSLRLWNVENFPPNGNVKKKGKPKRKTVMAKTDVDNAQDSSNKSSETIKIVDSNDAEKSNVENEPNLAVLNKNPKKKKSRKIVPLNTFWKQHGRSTVEGCKRMFDRARARHLKDDTFRMDYSDGCDYLRIYGERGDVVELLNMEESAHKETFYWDAWAVIGIMKGDVKGVIDSAAEQGKLTPSLISIAPSVSHRYWKEILVKYSTQIVADSSNTLESYHLDGLGRVWQALTLLSAGQIDEGCLSFGEIGLEAEAVCAARARYMDHIADRHLESWIKRHVTSGNLQRAAECYLALGNIIEAASTLGRSNDEEDLALASIMAKFINDQKSTQIE